MDETNDFTKGGGGRRPAWAPACLPDQDTLAYISTGLTAALLLLVAVYLVSHFARGGSSTQGATVAAGVGVGGAGAA